MESALYYKPLLDNFTSDNITSSNANLCIQGQSKQNSEVGSSPLRATGIPLNFQHDLVTVMLFGHLSPSWRNAKNSEVLLSCCWRSLLPYHGS